VNAPPISSRHNTHFEVSEEFALKNWAGRFMDCADVTRVTAYGDPDASAREILDRLGASYHSAWGGFSRF
jgi:hypothetical protein